MSRLSQWDVSGNESVNSEAKPKETQNVPLSSVLLSSDMSRASVLHVAVWRFEWVVPNKNAQI